MTPGRLSVTSVFSISLKLCNCTINRNCELSYPACSKEPLFKTQLKHNIKEKQICMINNGQEKSDLFLCHSGISVGWSLSLPAQLLMPLGTTFHELN